MMTASLLGLITMSTLSWGASRAAFTSKAANPGSSWAAGVVSISDDDIGTAMFNVAGIQPGDNGQMCLKVTYAGNVAAPVKLYRTSTSGSLGAYLTITVDQGTGGSSSTCTGFSGSTIYSGTLSALGTTFGTGSGTWNPNTSGNTQTYRISWTVQDDNNAAGTTLQTTFTWEAQNA
jgi:hypothetical protein